jgi:hypothetical protein
MALNDVAGVGGYMRPEIDESPPAGPAHRRPVHPPYSGIGVDDWQHDDFGRVQKAGNGTTLPGYLVDNDPRQAGVQSWNGDWSDIRYPPITYSNNRQAYYSELITYLCQRFLDLTAPANPTLTDTQKAVLVAQVLYDPQGGNALFQDFLSRYLRFGNVFENFDLGNWNATNHDVIQKVAEKLLETEKLANLPNAEMREANRLIEQVAAEARGGQSSFSGRLSGFWV